MLNRRFADGLTGVFSFSANSVRENRIVEEYDREPTLWQGTNGGRPYRISASATYELPFDDIAVDNSTLDQCFNVDAGFEKEPAKIPAAFQKRQFPFRVDDVRGQALSFLNMREITEEYVPTCARDKNAGAIANCRMLRRDSILMFSN